jgi:membrane fusion protein (multidrug efflux system)
MTSRRPFLITGAIAGLIIVGLVASRFLTAKTAETSRKASVASVSVEPVRTTAVHRVLRFTGDVVALQQANIYAKVSGNLERVLVDIGTPVRAGSLLALIDTTELAQQYQQAKATYENARVTWVRSKELFDQNLVSRQDLDNAETASKVSRALFEAAGTRLGYARVTAPFPGWITKRFLDPGALVTTNNSSLFTLMDLDHMKVAISILEKDIPLIEEGRQAVITVDAYPGKEFPGRISRFSNAVDPGTRTMAVEIDVPNPDHRLKPGMFANVSLDIETHNDALTIPIGSIMRDDRGPFVFTVVSDTARKVRIVPGIEQDGAIEIVNGLQGVPVVISMGQQFLKDGSPVTVQKAVP